MPEAATKAPSMYLPFAIGFKGGAAFAKLGADAQFLTALVGDVVLSFALPFVAFAVLLILTRLSVVDAVMVEFPARVSALWLVPRRGGTAEMHSGLRREVLLNGSIVLLVRSFLIGLISGADGLARIESFIIPPFHDILCLLLPGMRLVAWIGLQISRGELRLGTVPAAMRVALPDANP